MTPRVLVIAGSDPLAYSGLRADLRHLDTLRCRGAGVVTAWTVQTVDRLLEVRPVDVASVRDGIAAARAAGPVDAVKVGMLHRAEVVDAVGDALADVAGPIIVDPVIDAGGGGVLLDEAGRDALRTRLLPLATLVAPNLPELRALGPSAEDLLVLGAEAVLVTGGHGEPSELVDVLVTADGVRPFEGRRVHGVAPRGTGCALTTAIAALLARGGSLGSSVESAIRSVRAAVAACAARGTRLLVLD
ncbi:MAG: hydroxymethylpyrimidine/phosphomethylpyrimidine kinase [Planctomycetes bacterium]|nr:hydroxymethylpyrimidine/phosphomethylpyrimidine kinase [Planctomycetota bacterium]